MVFKCGHRYGKCDAIVDCSNCVLCCSNHAARATVNRLRVEQGSLKQVENEQEIPHFVQNAERICEQLPQPPSQTALTNLNQVKVHAPTKRLLKRTRKSIPRIYTNFIDDLLRKDLKMPWSSVAQLMKDVYCESEVPTNFPSDIQIKNRVNYAKRGLKKGASFSTKPGYSENQVK